MEWSFLISTRNFVISGFLIGAYSWNSFLLYGQSCGPVPPPLTGGPCGQQESICENSALNTCLQNGGTCASCNVSSTYSACGTAYSQCIQNEKDYCRAGWSCPGIGNYPNCNLDKESEQCFCSCECGSTPPNCPNPVCQSDGTWICDSPIVLDTMAEGFHLTSAAGGVNFDLWADGIVKKFSWTDPAFHNGWLALDRNNNGVIDNGAELFGSATPQPAPPLGETPNGFRALAVYDERANGGNSNGFIDPGDAIYDKLLVWVDSNHDGFSQPSELKRLKDVHVSKIDLNYQLSKFVDQFGNTFYYRARVWDEGDSFDGRWVWDVYLLPAE